MDKTERVAIADLRKRLVQYSTRDPHKYPAVWLDVYLKDINMLLALIEPGERDAIRMLAGMLGSVQKAWIDALTLHSADELRDHITLKTPITQGLRNQWALEKIGAQPFDREAATEVLNRLEALTYGGQDG